MTTCLTSTASERRLFSSSLPCQQVSTFRERSNSRLTLNNLPSTIKTHKWGWISYQRVACLPVSFSPSSSWSSCWWFCWLWVSSSTWRWGRKEWRRDKSTWAIFIAIHPLHQLKWTPGRKKEARRSISQENTESWWTSSIDWWNNYHHILNYLRWK